MDETIKEYTRSISDKLKKEDMAFLKKNSGDHYQFSESSLVIRQIERAMKHYRDNLALIYDTVQLRYKDLDEITSGICINLQKKGIKKGGFIPILTNDPVLLVVSILSLMKLGAVFVIIDSKWPKSRIRNLISNIESNNIITSSKEGDLGIGINEIKLNWNQILNSEIVDKAPIVDMSRDEPLYGFFTSGTTGLPKCCINKQAGLINRFNNMDLALNLKCDETVLVNSNLTFDSSLWQILWPLSRGAKIVIPTSEQRKDVRKIAELMGKNKVAMTDFVPSTFRLLVKYLKHSDVGREYVSYARYIIVGGEKVNVGCIQDFYRHIPTTTLMNTYGPTEASIGMMFYKIPRNSEDIPIGKPIKNTFSVIMDESGDLCAPGEIGEIVIGGVCLGLGYKNAPEKTKEVFVENRIPWIPGDKLYRTGDLGYLRNDGNFQFISRKNDCIKLNGEMVSLPEIENTIRKMRQVDDVCVVVSSKNISPLIFAFVIIHDKDVMEFSESDIIHFLQDKLPSNFIPKGIKIKNNFPLTENGKVDRTSLINECNEKNKGKEEQLDHLKLSEEGYGDIYEIVSSIMGKRSINIDDNLVDIGLDSLCAMNISIEIEIKLNKKVTISEIYRNPTIKLLSDHIHGHSSTDASDETQTIKKDYELLNGFGEFKKSNCSEKGVLLTGGTGYVGVHLAAELAKKLPKQENVIVLVRAENDALARERLAGAFSTYNLNPVLLNRITVYSGDISKAEFGCNSPDIAQIFNRVDRVIMNAAMVNFLFDYASLRSTNVLFLHHLSQLMSLHGKKELIYISSLAVFNGMSKESIKLPEDISLREVAPPRGGYAKSKLVAEVLLDKLRDKNINVSIIRLGEIMPSDTSGKGNENSFICLYLNLISKLKASIKTEARISYTPVDKTAEAITLLVIKNKSVENKNYHLFHQEKVYFESLVEKKSNDENVKVRRVSAPEFNKSLKMCDFGNDVHLLAKVESVLGQFKGCDPLFDYFSMPQELYSQHNFLELVSDDDYWNSPNYSLLNKS
ncbi:AMP-binding protein [Vibrio sp. Of7-15]|uniref:non-ribosomal peptide synthetase n=1 Tax=Vibrio sp. Of7-15 TaxID=2724879 RepID=UPI001EF31ABE|nr:AMP-binding protein [Vibrio sp. Of7-15]MCG7500142.1 AMP-binding protein [Vibrio sp. Of7-15]